MSRNHVSSAARVKPRKPSTKDPSKRTFESCWLVETAPSLQFRSRQRKRLNQPTIAIPIAWREKYNNNAPRASARRFERVTEERERERDHTDLPKDNAATSSGKFSRLSARNLSSTRADARAQIHSFFVLLVSQNSLSRRCFSPNFPVSKSSLGSLRFVASRTNTKVPKISFTLWITRC